MLGLGSIRVIFRQTLRNNHDKKSEKSSVNVNYVSDHSSRGNCEQEGERLQCLARPGGRAQVSLVLVGACLSQSY